MNSLLPSLARVILSRPVVLSVALPVSPKLRSSISVALTTILRGLASKHSVISTMSTRRTLSMASAGRKGRRIIIGCDGTWLNSDDGLKHSSYLPWGNINAGSLATPSNVTRFCRALQPVPEIEDGKSGNSSNGVEQIVDYQPGIGSSNNWWDHFINGATAMSIGDNVNQAYVSIVEKYVEGDEIFLIGFSRGSFIARSIAAMIADVGLLTKEGLENFYDIFQDWENQNIPSWKQKLFPGKSMKDKNNGDYSPYAKELEAHKWTRLGIRIKAVCVWDTVGSLGVPTIGWRKPTRTYAFVNTEPPWNVDYCIHALALDEFRVPFSPTLWELPDSRVPGNGNSNPCVLRQVWFPGVHSCIGGSVADAELPDIALAWMVCQLAPLLDFDAAYLSFCREMNVKYYKDKGLSKRQWGMGFIPNPMTCIQLLGGSAPRTPGRYCRTNPETGKFTNIRLKNTNERVHPSVRIRRFNRRAGKGVSDAGVYSPPALNGFVLENKHRPDSDKEYDPCQQGYLWKYQNHDETIVLEEESLGDIEVLLLENEGLAPFE